MESFIEQARLYSSYHTKKITLYTHLIGVPLVVFSLMIFLSFFHLSVPKLFDITFASMATFALILYYLVLNWRLALAIIPILITLLWLSLIITFNGVNHFSIWFFIITFVLGWIFQLIGHLFEAKRPAFLDNILQFFIAPLFIVAELFFLAGRMQSLKEHIHSSQGE